MGELIQSLIEREGRERRGKGGRDISGLCRSLKREGRAIKVSFRGTFIAIALQGGPFVGNHCE